MTRHVDLDQFDAGVICVDDTNRNARELAAMGASPVRGQKCAGCRCTVIADPATLALAQRATIGLFCLRCARAATTPEMRCAGLVPGVEGLFAPETVEAHLRRSLHDLIDTAARNSMGGAG